MIEIEHVTNRFSRIYRTVDDIKNLLLRIRLADELSENENISTFKWQQKRFSPQQKVYYKDMKNCISDLEKEYHQQVIKETRRDSHSASIIFSYTSADKYIPDTASQKFTKQKMKHDHAAKLDSELVAIMENHCHLNNSNEIVEDNGNEGTDVNTKSKKYNKMNKQENKVYDYFESLQGSCANIIPEDENLFEFEVMYIMADFGEFYQSTWLKCEHTLAVIRYDAKRKVLMMTPDFTVFHAHMIKVTSEETKIMRYWIENASLDGVTSKELLREVNLLHQLQSCKRAKTLPNFEKISENDTMHVYIFMEILSGWDFEYSNVFVKYYIQLNNWKLLNDNNCLSGVTTACSKQNSKGKLHFGLPIDFALVSTYKSTEDPVVYFELISKDTWSRYRCEGLARMSLPIRLPGTRMERLHCYRITSSGVVNELRRFFIGDCANYHSIFAASSQISQNEVVNELATTTISTGCLEIRTSIMHFSGSTEADKSYKGWENLREMRLRDKLRDPQLTRTVEEAVEAFKSARAAMLEARLAV